MTDLEREAYIDWVVALLERNTLIAFCWSGLVDAFEYWGA